MSESNATSEETPAYGEGYADACETTDALVSTLMEDVENYHQAYVRILKLYTDHMAQCSRFVNEATS